MPGSCEGPIGTSGATCKVTSLIRQYWTRVPGGFSWPVNGNDIPSDGSALTALTKAGTSAGVTDAIYAKPKDAGKRRTESIDVNHWLKAALSMVGSFAISDCSVATASA